MLSGELKWGACRCVELFCLPSHQETFGIVVAEALSCGLPVAIAEPVNISAEVQAAGAGLVHVDSLVGLLQAVHHWLALLQGAKDVMIANAPPLLLLNTFFRRHSVPLIFLVSRVFSAQAKPFALDSNQSQFQ